MLANTTDQRNDVLAGGDETDAFYLHVSNNLGFISCLVAEKEVAGFNPEDIKTK